MTVIVNLKGEVIHEIGSELSYANLSGTNLTDANLTDANLSRANLSRANLSHANLSYANLSHANLSHANLGRANLTGANLSYANLMDANLMDANLSYACLSHANLVVANLTDANLGRANLTDANLSYACLSYANLGRANLIGALGIPEVVAAQTSITPDGELIVWKACKDGVIVKLKVPVSARRSNATTRKCRAEWVEVLEVFGDEIGVSIHDPSVVYRPGEIVRCHEWNDDRWVECGGGIHFFLTRLEAEHYKG